MKHLLIISLITVALAMTACLGRRSSGAKSAAISSGDNGGGRYIDRPDGGDGTGGGNRGGNNSGSDNGNNNSYQGNLIIVSASPSAIVTQNPELTPGQPSSGSVQNPDVTQIPSTTQDPNVDPIFQHPKGITVVTSLNNLEVAGLQACGNYMYSVTKYTGKISASTSVKQVLHRLKINNRFANNFVDISLKKSGSSEAPYLIDGLTCIDNQYLAGTYRYFDKKAWYEYLFIFNPIDKTIPFVEKIYTSPTTSDNQLWRTSQIRNSNYATGVVANDEVKNDLIRVVKVGDDIVLTIFKEKYKFDRYILPDGRPSNIIKLQNNSLVSAGSATKDYYDATIVPIPGTQDILTAQMEKGSDAPSIYRWGYKSKSGTKISLSNVNVTFGDKDLDVNLINLGEKNYIFLRTTSSKEQQTLKQVFELDSLANNNFDGTGKDGRPLSLTFQARNVIERMVYASEGLYAFINTAEKLAGYTSGSSIGWLGPTFSEQRSFELPRSYYYLLRYIELKKIAKKYAENAPFIAGGIDGDEVYISFPYQGKNLTYKGQLSEFVEWSNNLK